MKRKSNSVKPTAAKFAEDQQPQVTEVIAWMSMLAEPGHTYELWIKKTQGQYLGGYYSYDQIDTLVAKAMQFSGKAFGVYWSINPVDPEHADDEADHELKPGKGVPKDSDIIRRRLLPIDVDPVRQSDISATVEEKQRAKEKSLEIRRYLNELGWPKPVTVDSGNGFYLLYRVDLPTDDNDLVSGVLKKISQKFSNEHVEIDTTVANAGRVLKIPGTMACKGKSTKQRPHRVSRVIRTPKDGLQEVSRELLESLAGHVVQEAKPTTTAVPALPVPPQVIERARQYLGKMPKAIQGQNGSGATLTAATRIVVGFNIAHDSADALQLMQEYSQRCQPPWSDKELRHKLKEADRLATEKGEPRGHLRKGLSGTASGMELAPLDGPEFLIDVPDYEYVAVDQVFRSVEHFSQTSPWYGLGVHLVWQHQRSDALIPEVLARQVHWGANFPVAWRRTMLKKKGGLLVQKECRSDCPLFGSNVRHQHLVRNEGVWNGWLEWFSIAAIKKQIMDQQKLIARAQKSHRKYRFWSKDKRVIDRREKSRGLFFRCYFPILIFGRSPQLGLTSRQQRLMLGVTRELTRVGVVAQYSSEKQAKPKFVKAYSSRKDRAEVIVGRKVAPSGDGSRKVVCPLLDEGQRYVVFGGNLRKHRGRGYRIFNDKTYCWLWHAGHPSETFKATPWPCVRNFLDDLVVLAERFDLVVVGRHHKRNEWKSLAEMRACLKSGSGQDWLTECTLRIFAPEDYLVRWRYTIAKRLGFRWIRGGEDCPYNVPGTLAEEKTISDGTQLRAWLDQQGWSIQQLADRVKCDRKTVSRHLHDKRKSPAFWQRVSKVVRQPSK